MIGQAIAHYRVTAKLGAGGMGEVYRATDTKLARNVALKVLPHEFLADAQRVARFQREARLLAALSHPHIATIHGLEEAGSTRALVMELVEGPTLADRIFQGAIPLDEALPIARQIAEALEYAHERGIIHRDLKPANIKLTAEGKVKVLDFGLAKAMLDDATFEDVENSPTLNMAATRANVILGTAAYMSPEQARGAQVDKRADIWAFGCVLHEMLTGKRLFDEDTASDTLAAVLRGELDFAALSTGVPRSIRRLLERCLERDRKRRLRDIGEARIAIENALAHPGADGEAGEAPQKAAPVRTRILPWALAGILAVAAVWLGWSLKPMSPSRPSTVSRFMIPLPPTDQMGELDVPAVALSPDGMRMVYVARRDGKTQIYMRPMDSIESRPVPETEGASYPFFSPDGQWLGFVAGGKLRKVSVAGGAPVALTDITASLFGVHWASDESIVVAPSFESGLWKIPSTGGVGQRLTTVDAEKGEAGHQWPYVLPGGKAILFTVALLSADTYDDALIVVQSLETGERKELIRGGTFARYVPTGHIVYTRSGTLMAAPFDAQRLEVTGRPVPLLEDAMQTFMGAAQFSFSRQGDFVSSPGGSVQLRRGLAWVDRDGRSEPVPLPRGPYVFPSLSPDGRQITVQTLGVNCQVLVYDVAREALTRLTLGGDNHSPLWTPDGKRIVFESTKTAPSTFGLRWQPADGSGAAEWLTESEGTRPTPDSISPDGKLLAFVDVERSSGKRSIWLLPLEGDRKPRPFLRTDFDTAMPRFSPDGRWLAYVSDHSGRLEVYVQPFPDPGPRWQISTDGGSEPVWNPKGGELFYRTGDKMMAVDVVTAPSFSAGRPRLLFEGSYLRTRFQSPFWHPQYDVTRDGRRFLMMSASEEEISGRQIHVVLNWFEELKRLAPTDAQ